MSFGSTVMLLPSTLAGDFGLEKVSGFGREKASGFGLEKGSDVGLGKARRRCRTRTGSDDASARHARVSGVAKLCKMGPGKAGEGDPPITIANGASTTAVVAVINRPPRL
ncbi:uncharacterized protein IUM83_11539 [Phytophthora cinnamomi]|uniref:uncharacterized protein n=1 Tax=Phytophthora cinnamomi TaxID=4785 RepID=UPI003559FA45|nr:hypothetical protein IUM83_11539 [Phytophthora cinnamomi]